MQSTLHCCYARRTMTIASVARACNCQQHPAHCTVSHSSSHCFLFVSPSPCRWYPSIPTNSSAKCKLDLDSTRCSAPLCSFASKRRRGMERDCPSARESSNRQIRLHSSRSLWEPRATSQMPLLALLRPKQQSRPECCSQRWSF